MNERSIDLGAKTLVVFDHANMPRALAWCKAQPDAGSWCVLRAFETSAEEADAAPVRCADLLAAFPYQPSRVTVRVRECINALFATSRIRGRSVEDAAAVLGVPIVRAKDNELMEYTLHRLYFFLECILSAVREQPDCRIHLLVDRDDVLTIPEWPSFHRLLDLDAVYAPILSRVLRQEAASASLLGLVTVRARRGLHAVREFMLFSRRLATVLARGIRWHDERLPPTGLQRVAVWVRARGQAREVQPLVERWMAEGKVAPFFVQDDSYKKTDCYDYLRANSSLPFVAMHRFLTPGTVFRALGRYLRYRLVDMRGITFSRAETGHAVSRVLLQSADARRELLCSVAEAVFSASIAAEEIRRCHDRYPFRVMLVLSTFDLWGHVAAYLGRHLGFSTVSLQNFNSDPWAYPTPCSLYDAHVTFDEKEKARLVQAGAPADRIHPLGGIIYSRLRSRELLARKREAVRERLGIAKDSLVVLVGTQSAAADATKENAHLLRLLFDAVQGGGNAMGIVKPHPYEKIEDYAEWIERARQENIPVRFLQKENIDDLAAAADAYISRFSTTTLLAVMMRRPTLSFTREFERQRALDSVEFLQSGVINTTSEYETARAWLQSILDGRGDEEVLRQEEKLRREYSTYDEQGEYRIQRLVESMLVPAHATEGS